MPEGVGYGPQDTASVGLTLNVIGNNVYAYSGAVSCPNSETDLINATTGNYYMVAQVQFSGATSSIVTEDIYYRIRLNGELIMLQLQDQSAINYAQRNNINLLVPPYTQLRLTGESASTARDQVVVVVGKIYGKIE